MDLSWCVQLLHETIIYLLIFDFLDKNVFTVDLQVDLRYKLNFHECSQSDTWGCLSGDCGIETSIQPLYVVKAASTGEWCQTEGIMTRQVQSNAPFELW